MIVRFEPFGAWVKLESMPALVALDREGVLSLGLDGGAAWGDSPPDTPPLEVHMAVTSRCGAGCEGCYLDARPDGLEPPLPVLLQRLDALQEAGVFTVAFGGGEPTTRSDLPRLAAEARRRGMTAVLTTSGIGLTQERAKRLAGFAQINVSYDGEGAAYASVRGFDGARAAEAAIRVLAEEGIRVGVNVVLTRTTFPRLAATLTRARALGALEAQLLRYKPAGRAAGVDYLARRLTPEQAESLGPALRRLVAEHDRPPASFPIRIDCSMVPFLSADPEIYTSPELLRRWGVFGCEGGQALAALTVDGTVAPCSFAPPTRSTATDVPARLGEDPTVRAWRSFSRSAPEPCRSCNLSSVCKGGCKVVAAFIHPEGPPLSPDPECPRVRAHRAAGGQATP